MHYFHFIYRKLFVRQKIKLHQILVLKWKWNKFIWICSLCTNSCAKCLLTFLTVSQMSLYIRCNQFFSKEFWPRIHKFPIKIANSKVHKLKMDCCFLMMLHVFVHLQGQDTLKMNKIFFFLCTHTMWNKRMWLRSSGASNVRKGEKGWLNGHNNFRVRWTVVYGRGWQIWNSDLWINTRFSFQVTRWSLDIKECK